MTNQDKGLAMSQPIKRRVILNHPPASSPWHWPAGISVLTSLLRASGHDVVQRYGHIIGLENVLRSVYPGIGRALDTIRNPKSEIEALYDARMTLERTSANLHTKDSFGVIRNNVRYAHYGYNGEVETLKRAVDNRCDSMWHRYFRDVEVPFARKHKPDIYGISINDERQIVPGCILAAMVKDACPETLVVLGGNVWSRLRHVFTKEFAPLFNHFDAIVYSEGFGPIMALAETLSPKSTPGTVWRSNGSLTENPILPRPIRFDTLPTPSFDGSADTWSPDNVMPLYTASNCSQRCNYCAISGGSDTFLGKARYMTPEQIARQMKELAHIGTRFDITDETFHVHRQLALGRALREIGHSATWQCYLTVSKFLLNKGVCKALYNAGCRAVQLGLETLSTDSLTQENKGWNVPANYGQILQNLSEAGIQVHAFIIVGIPGESMAQMLKWLPFIEKYGRHIVTIKPARYRLTRTSPEERDPKKLADLNIEALPDKAPLRLNREFRYCDEKGHSIRKDVGATLALIEEACRRHKPYAATSTLPWWTSRGRYTVSELNEMASKLSEEPEDHRLKESIRRAGNTIKDEQGNSVKFGNFDDVLRFFRNTQG